MYKDKDKQREAQRNWVRQKRAVKGSTKQGSTLTGESVAVAIKAMSQAAGKAERAEAERTAQARFKAKKVLPEQGITGGGITEVINDIGVRDEVLEAEGLKPKRGKDIKCFEDLPPDVQQIIHRLSTINGRIDQTIKANRTAFAINYQHTCPERY